MRNKCKEAERERRTQVRQNIGTPRRRAIGKSSAPTTTMTIPRCRMMTDRAGLRSAKINPAPYNAGDAPDFVEVGEAGIAVGDAMRRQLACSTSFVTTCLAAMSSQRGSERWQVFVGFQPTEALDCFQHAGCGPAQCHGSISPSFHVAADAPHRPHHVLDGVGAGERAPELAGKSKAVDGEEFVEPFEDAGADPGRLMFEPASEIA